MADGIMVAHPLTLRERLPWIIHSPVLSQGLLKVEGDSVSVTPCEDGSPAGWL